MFNLQKQEITMKKYIAPVAQIIDIQTENLMALSFNNNVGSAAEASNRRSASESIWGSDEEE